MTKFLLSFSVLLTLGISLVKAQSPFTGKPRYEILVKRTSVNIGTITIELFPNIAPLHVKNFDSLVSVQFFDSTAFHRVIPGFMIQGGDPNSRHGAVSTWGYGDPNQPNVNAEFTAAKHLRGTLSAARDNDINSANSQFFICVAPASWLNNQYSIYGQVVAGMNYVDTIVSAPRDANDNPFQKIEMFITRAGSNDTIPNKPSLNTPVSGTTNVGTSKQLKWNAVTDAIIYTLEVSTDSLFSTLFKTVNVGAPTLTSTVTALAQGTKYFWRVKVNNGGHFSEYSDVWSFNTNPSNVGIGSLVDKKNEPSIFPNPSKGNFTISNLLSGSTVMVYDITGRMIYKEIAKSNVHVLNIEEVAKGIYFLKVTSDQSVIEKRIVVE